MSTLLHYQADLVASRPAFSTSKFSKEQSLHAVSSASGHVAASDGHQVLVVPGGGSSLSHSQGLAFAPPTTIWEHASIHSLHWSPDELLCITAGSQVHVYQPGATAGPPLLMGGLRCPYPIRATAWHPSEPHLLAMATEHAIMLASVEPLPSRDHPQPAHSSGVTVTGACKLLGVQHRPSSLPAALSTICLAWVPGLTHQDTPSARVAPPASSSVHALAVSWGSHLQILIWTPAAALPQNSDTCSPSHLTHSVPWECVHHHHVAQARHQGPAALLSNPPSALAGLPGGGLVVCWDNPLTIRESISIQPKPIVHTSPSDGISQQHKGVQPHVQPQQSRAPISLVTRPATTSPKSHNKPTSSTHTATHQLSTAQSSSKAAAGGQLEQGSKQGSAMDDSTLAMLASLGVGVGLAGPEPDATHPPQPSHTEQAVSSGVEAAPDVPAAVPPSTSAAAAVTASAGIEVVQGVQESGSRRSQARRVLIQEVAPASPQSVHSVVLAGSPDAAQPVGVGVSASASGDAVRSEAVQVASQSLPPIGDLLSGQFGSRLMIDRDGEQQEEEEAGQQVASSSAPALLTTAHASRESAAQAAARGLLLEAGSQGAGGEGLPACGVLAVLRVTLEAGHTGHTHHVSSTWSSTSPLYLPHPTLLSVLPYPVLYVGQAQHTTTQGGGTASGAVAAGVSEGLSVVIGVASATAPPLVQLFTLDPSASQSAAQPVGVLHLPVRPQSGITAQGYEGSRLRGLALGWSQGVQGVQGQVKLLCVHVMHGRTSPAQDVAVSAGHAGAAPTGSFTLLKRKGHVSTTLHDLHVAQYSVPLTCLPTVQETGGVSRAAIAPGRCEDTAGPGGVESSSSSSRGLYELLQSIERKIDLYQQQSQAGFERVTQQMAAFEQSLEKLLQEMEARVAGRR